jgi:CHAD domain-containing protein
MLELTETVLPRKTVRKMRRKIRKPLNEASALRDIQVQQQHCETLVADFPQLGAFLKFLGKRERKFARRLRKKLSGVSPSELQAGTGILLEKLIVSLEPDQDKALAARIEAAIEDAWRRVLYLRARVNPREPATIHKMRLAFKRFRYMAEVTAPVFPQLSRERLRAMHSYQDRMGAIQDMETLMRSMMQFRRSSGRTSMLVVENEIRRRRQGLIDSFMRGIDELRFFWSDRPTETREVV